MHFEPMHLHEEEAKSLPIGTFDHHAYRGNRKHFRYRGPNLIERSFGLPIAIAVAAVATVIFSRTDVGLVAAFSIILLFAGEWGSTAKENHERMWREVFALRGGLAHALSHSSATCTGCDVARRLVPEWDAEMRLQARAERDAP